MNIDSSPPTTSPPACPPADALARFVAGSVSGHHLDTLEHHVDTCSACRQSLAALVRGQAPLPTLGRYRVDGILGAGGMGIVYRGFDPELRRPVAIKVVRPGHDEGLLGLRARLGREAEAMAQLSHRNVCQVYDIGTEGDEVWVAIELVEGGSLRQWLTSAPSAAAIIDATAQICDGLHAAHAVGMCHRDVKPDNILIERGGRAVLTDFGLARPIDVAGKSTVVAGTIAYMAPELLEGAAPDARSDQYALAVTVHEALTGVRPRHGVVATSLPVGLRAVIGQALAVDPAARFVSVAALGAALRGDAAPAARPSRWPIALAAAVVLLAATVTGIFVWRRGQVATPSAGETWAVANPTPPGDLVAQPRDPAMLPPVIREPNTAPPIIIDGAGGGATGPSVGSAIPAGGSARPPMLPKTVAAAGSGTTTTTGGSGGGTTTGGGGTTTGAVTSDVRNITPPSNLRAVDAWQQWRTDYKAAQAAFGTAKPMQLQAYPVASNGLVNIARDRGVIISSFLSTTAKQGVPSDAPCGRSRMYYAAGAVESDLYVTSCGRSFAFPRCTISQIWRKAIAEGADPAIPANITYHSTGWGFRQDVAGSFNTWDFKDVDCASTKAGSGADALETSDSPADGSGSPGSGS